MRRDAARGAMALQMALCTPLFFVLVIVAVYAGRLEEGQARVDAAAHDAARSASLERSPAAATTAAQRTAMASLQASGSCAAPRVSVDVRGFRSGGTVAVTVDCDIERGDLTLLPVPGQSTLTARFVSTVDLFEATS